MTTAQQVYLLGGLAFASEVPLPELPECTAPSAAFLPRITIRVGRVAFSLPGGVEVDPDCLATPSEYLLRVPGIATYRVSRGSEVVVDPERNAIPLDVRAFLLGTVFAVLCHQRGLLPLHASAISSGTKIVAFVAASGQGKSSLVANLAQRGFRVVADDICLVDMGLNGDTLVIPTAPWLKLWRASLQQLGRRPEGLDPVFSEDDKYRIPLEPLDEPASDRQPIRELIFLERATNGGAANARLTKIDRIRALPLLMNLVHQAYLVEAIGKREESFVRCGQIVSRATPYRLLRPWGFEYMEQTVDAVETLLRRGEDDQG